jgi:hypothetical protein
MKEEVLIWNDKNILYNLSKNTEKMVVLTELKSEIIHFA